MKLRILAAACLTFAAWATCTAQQPDLTITAILWRDKPHTVQLTVANLGQAKAAESTGSYACQTAPNEKGISFSFGTLFSVPALAAKQKWKVVLDCKNNRITGAAVDAEKKVSEADENNNEMSFAEAQQKKGPLKKPGS